VKGLNKSYTGI